MPPARKALPRLLCMCACREAWHLEVGSGHHWLARRVPHDAFFVTGNQGRFKVGSGHHWLARRVPRDAFLVTGNQGRFKERRTCTRGQPSMPGMQ